VRLTCESIKKKNEILLKKRIKRKKIKAKEKARKGIHHGLLTDNAPLATKCTHCLQLNQTMNEQLTEQGNEKQKKSRETTTENKQKGPKRRHPKQKAL